MKIPLSWIKRFINISQPVEELSDLLTLSGIEVEKIERNSFDFENVIIGLVEEIHPHKNADKLRVARVTDGKHKYTVVCGAPNLTLHKKVAFAPIGAILEKSTKNPFKIKKAKIRGIESQGMLCSEKELGIGKDHNGILLLEDSAPVGENFITYYKDPVYDVTLTPNLGHCRSILGIARELARFCSNEVTLPKIAIEKSTGKDIHNLISITNQLEEKCPQYAIRMITGIEVKESPTWMKNLLEKSGIASINNVVDVTNYVLHELGQPLHAFDYHKIKDKNLIIRESVKNEELQTLDDKKHILDAGHIVITSGNEPIALGGIMGGKSTAISETTHTVILEAGEFCSSTIRKSSRSLKIRTESSSRFENKIDRGNVVTALNYTAFLLQEIAGGSVSNEFLEDSPLPFRPKFLTARLSRINKILGTKLSLNEIEQILTSIGFSATTDGEDLLQLKVPSWRNDVKYEIDIIEEVARVYGYNNISVEHPTHITSTIPHHPLYTIEKLLRNKLTLLGLQEFITCSLINTEENFDHTSDDKEKNDTINVLHAKSIDQSVLRPSLLPGMLSCVQHNKNNGTLNIRAFEIGKIFSQKKESYNEDASLGILLSGNAGLTHYSTKSRPTDFFDIKGILTNFLKSIHLNGVKTERSSHSTFHPGIQANIVLDGITLGSFGKIHPKISEKMKINENTFFAELNIYLLEKYRIKNNSFKEISSQPSSYRDATFSLKKGRELNDLFTLLDNHPFSELKRSELIDIYHDEKNIDLKQHVTFRFTYQDNHKTLDDNAISECHQKVLKYISPAL